MATAEKVTSPEWTTIHSIADAAVPEMTSTLIDVWDAQRERISVEDLGLSLSRSGQENINWKIELAGLQGAMVQSAGEVARKTALALLPRLEKQKQRTERFADWIDLSFDLRFMAAEDFLGRYLPMLIVRINEETRRAISDIVLEGFRTGKHPYQMAEEIKGLVGMLPGQVRAYQAFAANLAKGNISAVGQANALAAYRTRALEYRARNIARTETLRAANAGQMTLWRSAMSDGLLGLSANKKWINTPGPRTCPTCQGMRGQTAKLDQPFNFGGYPIDMPPGHPSCRCAMGLTFDDVF